MKKTLFAFALVLATFGIGARPALADSGLSLGLGEHFVFQSNVSGSVGTMTDFSATYDVGPHVPVVPIRGNLQFDYATGGGQQRFTGGGIGARLTTPLYVGVGLGIYNVNGLQSAGPFPGQGGGFIGSPTLSTSTTGFGSNFVVGSQLFGIPGGSRLDLEAAFKQLPVSNGLNLSGATIGVRLRF